MYLPEKEFCEPNSKLVELISEGNSDELFSKQLCLEFINSFVGNKAVIIKTNESCSALINSYNVDDSSIQAYEEHFFQLDPMRHCRKANTALRMSDTVPTKRFEASEFYNDFYKPMASYHSLSIKRSIGKGETIEIAINRGKSCKDFNSEDKKRFKKIASLLAARIGVIEGNMKIPQFYRADKLELISTLSERELEVFLHISSGNSLSDFKEANDVSIHTARTFLKSVLQKLDADSQLELSKIARAIA